MVHMVERFLHVQLYHYNLSATLETLPPPSTAETDQHLRVSSAQTQPAHFRTLSLSHSLALSLSLSLSLSLDIHITSPENEDGGNSRN